VKIVQAVLALIETAMKDESVTHVLVVTESCVPVVDVTVAIRTLIGMEESANVATGPPYKSFMSCYTSESTKFTTFDRESVWGKLGLNGFGGDVGGVGVTVVKSLPGWTAIGRSDCEGVLEVEEECEEVSYASRSVQPFCTSKRVRALRAQRNPAIPRKVAREQRALSRSFVLLLAGRLFLAFRLFFAGRLFVLCMWPRRSFVPACRSDISFVHTVCMRSRTARSPLFSLVFTLMRAPRGWKSGGRSREFGRRRRFISRQSFDWLMGGSMWSIGA